MGRGDLAMFWHFRQFGQLQVEKILRGAEKYNKGEVSSWWHCLPYQLSTGRALRVELESFQCAWSGNQALRISPVNLFLAKSNVTNLGLIHILLLIHVKL